MKKTCTQLFFLGLCCMAFTARAQEMQAETDAIHRELTAWDPVRGAWLAESMFAVAAQQPIPDRTFPENVTPQELYTAVPEATRARIAQRSNAALQNAGTPQQRTQWQRISEFSQRTDCNLASGRTYGDPHLSSFDGATYSFQTVGEFILARSTDGEMEVQVRQQPQRDDFSLNTAVAMNVSGDRVSVYTDNYDTRAFRSLLHVNNQEIVMEENGAYFLPNGGVIRRNARSNYDVIWPTGEKVIITGSRNGDMNFMNVEVMIYPCIKSYEGILGNANGRKQDDFDTRGTSSRPSNLAFHSFGSGPSNATQEAMEKEYLAFLAKDFARSWRLTPQNTLFDYTTGQSTFTYTDESFPRVHHTLADLNPNVRNQAQRDCEARGIRGNDLAGCIYDQGFLNIPPTPRRQAGNPLDTVRMARLEKPLQNVNRAQVIRSQDISGERTLNETRTVPADNSIEPTRTKESSLTPAGDTGQRTSELNTKTTVKEPVKTSDRNVAPAINEPMTTAEPEVKEEPKPVIRNPFKFPGTGKPASSPSSTGTRDKNEHTKASTPVISTPQTNTGTKSGGTLKTGTISTPASSGGLRRN